MPTRRQLLQNIGAAALVGSAPPLAHAAMPGMPTPMAAPAKTAAPVSGAADYTIRIGTSLIELGPDSTVSTKTYNGRFPGPLLRFTEGKRITVDIYNDTDTPEQLHWHGQFLDPDVDGAAEEGTPYIAPHGMRRIAFTPGPPGFRFFHSHVAARTDLSLGLYSGQIGLVYIEPRHEAGAYDREIFLTLKEFGPYLSRTEMPHDFLAPTNTVPELRTRSQSMTEAALKRGFPPGYELGYNFFSVNGRMMGEGEPIRVRTGERVLFHILNASATEIRSLALPHHVFRVVALDGNAVPRPAEVPVLWLGPAERVSAIVEMKQPGIWTMGDVTDEDRNRGMGVVVEYAGQTGKPQWVKPPPFRWDYRLIARPGAGGPKADETITLTFTAESGAAQGFDRFAINGVSFSMEKMQPLVRFTRGRRYRLLMRNATDDVHPIHLHRNSFELSSIAGMPTAGVIKDVVMIGAFQEMSVDFTADRPGLSLFHCHMQHHMDFGFMALFDCR
jgi:FtsP/CotA-like multicopper oxidase with cupredoxin domain